MTPLPSVTGSLQSVTKRVLSHIKTRGATSELSDQWKGPQDVLSILLILGPDIIQRALAQLSGSTFTPVVFSFGWVAYAFSALLAAFGNGRLIPDADFAAILIPAKSGHVRNNRSWIIGRLLRDHEQRAAKTVQRSDRSSEKHEALRVTVFELVKGRQPGTIARDWIFYSGFIVMLAQFVVASLPIVFSRNWAILMVTCAGTILALLQGALPQWRREKWACPKHGGNTVSITQGNGSRHVMVILEDKTSGLELEILSTGGRNMPFRRREMVYISLLTSLWTVLLISVAGMSDDSWYLLAVGLMGIVHNVFVAGAPRDPGAFGIHLQEKETISSNTVANVLYQTEKRYPLVGSSLIPIFFSGGMRVPPDQLGFWSKAEEERSVYGYQPLNVTSNETTLNKRH